MKRMFFHLFVSITFFTVSVAVAVAATTLNYEYDANGNLVRGEGKYYEYNDANQLVRVRHNDASGAVLAEYVYDYNGQRIKKVQNGVTTYYIGKHYETQITDESQTNTSYYFANGERVAKKDTTGKLSYYHSDHLGGTNAVTDASGGLVERTKYYPFGEIREGGSEKYSYTGKEKDKPTDWYYYETRYYNPQIKHFTQADTVAPNIYLPQELNRYSYVNNNPLKLIDPSGNKGIISWFLGIWNTLFTNSTNNALQTYQHPETQSSIKNLTSSNLLLPPPSIPTHYIHEDIQDGAVYGDGQCVTFAKGITNISDSYSQLGYSEYDNGGTTKTMDYWLKQRDAYLSDHHSINNVDEGDVLVMDRSKNGKADHVAVVIKVSNNEFIIRESNINIKTINNKKIGKVSTETIEKIDDRIKGYYKAKLK
ncbi:RHS repeat-associated core domain-containing protein [Geobacter sp. AOG2]|uniref:RHS repeat-associated core domain-containing protein n=1 Tax=Geobacter sp. AOG2 TaxID=1566347 RepID=UPI001CC61102|nr:RHS repeat-associated core domain-containing protein [Geobacter sp. AOG2]GFE60791.1 hypothetical protein AOG2_13790 [Geobacter sp. AOG2]